MQTHLTRSVGLKFIARSSIQGGISLKEASFLRDFILENRPSLALEIGVGKGASALILTEALAEVGGRLYGIDPDQIEGHGSAALNLLRDHGLESHFELLPFPCHLGAPQLLSRDLRFDFVFIDGMHTFEFKIVDWFFADKLCRVGGHIAFHDLTFPSTKKVLKAALLSGRYRLIETPSLHLPPFIRQFRRLGSLVRRRPLWNYRPNGGCNLALLEKTSDTATQWDFYRDF